MSGFFEKTSHPDNIWNSQERLGNPAENLQNFWLTEILEKFVVGLLSG